MSSRITPRNTESCLSCKATIQWSLSLVVEVIGRRSAGNMKGWSNYIAKWKLAIASLLRLAPTILLGRMNIDQVLGAHWVFLSDAGRKIQKDLDIAEYTDPLHNPMIPHTI